MHARIGYVLQLTLLVALARGDGEPARLVDQLGDPLPAGAVARLGTIRLRHLDTVSSLAYSPDGRRLVSGSWDKTVRIWDAATGKPVRVLAGHAEPVTGVAYLPDGQKIVSASWDKTARVWDALTGRQITLFKTSRDRLHGVALSPDGVILAAAADRGRVLLWNLTTGESAGELVGPSAELRAVAFAPAPAPGPALAAGTNARVLAAAGVDRVITVWDAATQDEIRRLTGHDGPVNALAFSPNGTRLVSASDDATVIVWDLETGEAVHRFEGDNQPFECVLFTPTGREIVAGSADHRVRFWDVASEEPGLTLDRQADPVKALALAPDGKTLAVGPGGWGKTIRLFDGATGANRLELPGHTSEVASVDFTKDGGEVLSASWDSTIRVWDRQSGRQTRSLEGHELKVYVVRRSPDGVSCASGGQDNTLRLWDLATGQAQVLMEHQRTILNLDYSPNGTRIVSGGLERVIVFWDVAEGKAIGQIADQEGRIHGLAYSPDGAAIAAGLGSADENILRVFSATSGATLLQREGKAWPFYDVVFSLDSKRLYVASADGAIYVIEVATGAELAVLRGHVGQVFAIALAPAGDLLASGGYDSTVRVWDLEKNQEIRRFTGHQDLIHDVAFAPPTGGARLASASRDTTLLLWDVGAPAAPAAP